MKKNYCYYTCRIAILVLLGFVFSINARAQSCGIITTIAGDGTAGYSGDGGAATAAELYNPVRVAIDGSGNLYIADNFNNRVRKVTPTGIITTVAGNGTAGFSGDGSAATAAELNEPGGVAIDGSGNLFIADYLNNRVRKVTPGGVISTVAGNGTAGYSGDGGTATTAELYYPSDVAVDGSGNMYIADELNNRVRKVNSSGIISTIAGSGTSGYSGDGGEATAAELFEPIGLAIDGSNNLYIADYLNERIRKVNSTGIISTIAGSGTSGYSGDGGVATAADLHNPYGVAVDMGGNVYIADRYNHRIRKVAASGIISTIAGDGTAGYSGDGGTATTAELNYPTGVTVDGGGNVYIADQDNQRIRKVTPSAPVVSPLSGASSVFVGGTIILTDLVPGGTWASSNTAIATVSGGSVTGVAAGMDTISYSVSSSCGTTVVTQAFTVIDTSTNTLIHYWNFNSDAFTMYTPDIYGVPADYTRIDTATAKILYAEIPGTSSAYSTYIDLVTAATSDYDTINAQFGDAPGNALRARNPSDSMVLLFYIPSTHYKNLTFKFASEASSRTHGQLLQLYSYSTDSGATWRSSDLSVTSDSSGVWNAYAGQVVYSLVSVNFTTDDSVNNNPRLVFRIIFQGNTTGTSGNNRFDNVTLQGDTDIICITPTVGPISGASSLCAGTNITLTDTTSGGAWGSLHTGIATVSETGIVYGVAPGIDTITYTNSNICGNAIAKFPVSVITIPHPGAIAGADSVCPAATTTLSDTSSSGVWASLHTGIATVGSSGIVYGVAAGLDTISYTVTNVCGDSTVTVPVTVNPLPHAGTITGPTSVCATATISLSDTTSGGTWSSLHTSVATIGATGVVTGEAAGADTLAYSYTNSCGTAKATYPITVNAMPFSGTISGSSSICLGTGTTLTTTGTAGGSWSSSATSIATIDASTGIVTSVAAGTVTMSYIVTTASCGNDTSTFSLTVAPSPSPGVITGSSSSVCTGATLSLSESVSGGAWSSGHTSLATVSTGGVVSGVAVGADTIYYTLSACSIASYPVTVITLPSAGTITGTATSVCAGSTITLADGAGTGAWSSSDSTLATVGASSGVVTGVAAGSASISYTVTNTCGAVSATYPVTVNPLPDTGAITGTSTICLSTPTTLTESATGGSWSSSDVSIATVSATGVVTGVAAGSATISYTATTSSCGTASATFPITITTGTTAGTITGASSVCVDATLSLADATSGGAWTSASTSVATVDASGTVTGVTAGTVTISYTVAGSCTTVYTTATITVNPLPVTGTISGTSVFCAGTANSLSETAGGGVWSSSNTAIATISAAGSAGGVAAGVDTIYYAVTNGCGTLKADYVLTIQSPLSAGSITGLGAVCTGSTITLADGTSGGAWSSSNTSIATVTASGVVTGVTTGSVTITYTVTNTCGPVSAIKSVSVNAASGGAISGLTTVCPAATITLTDATGGGAWTSSNPSNATISGGVVYGVAAGTTTISYGVTSACGTAYATYAVTINPSPVAGAISGSATVCTGVVASLTDAAGGGSWSSANTSVATVDASGNVTGVAVGTVAISYSVTNSCGTAVATQNETVNLSPNAGTITGAASVCAGSSITLSDAAGGGSWSTSSAAIATTTAGGAIGGVAAGAVTISYSVTNGCGTAVATAAFTVNPLPVSGSISGPGSVCVGVSITLSDGAGGGVWSSAATSMATVDASGDVTGVAEGSTIISYTVTNGCGAATATKSVTINEIPSAGSISGATNICVTNTTTLTDATTGGAWSSGAPGVATVSATGVITGVSTGTDVISYGVTGICGTGYAVYVITVAPYLVSAITGSRDMCVGSTIELTDTAAGGTWSSASTTLATVSSTGVVTGVNVGFVNITYTYVNACGTINAVLPLDIEGEPDPGTISGPTHACIGTPITLTGSVSSPDWNVSNDHATVTTGGVVTGVSIGVDTIYHITSNICGAFSATLIDTVDGRLSFGSLGIHDTVCEGDSLALSIPVPGGYFFSSNGRAIVNATGKIKGITPGNDTITYSVVNGCGNSVAVLQLTVLPTWLCDLGVNAAIQLPQSLGLTLYPNPNQGTVTVNLSSLQDEQANLTLTNILGQKVTELQIMTNKETEMQLNVSAGIYLLTAATSNGIAMAKLVVE